MEKQKILEKSIIRVSKVKVLAEEWSLSQCEIIDEQHLSSV